MMIHDDDDDDDDDDYDDDDYDDDDVGSSTLATHGSFGLHLVSMKTRAACSNQSPPVDL